MCGSNRNLVRGSGSWQQMINNLSLVLLWTKKKKAVNPFSSLFHTARPVPCRFHKLCLTGLEISLAHCAIMNILSSLWISKAHWQGNRGAAPRNHIKNPIYANSRAADWQDTLSKRFLIRACQHPADRTPCWSVTGWPQAPSWGQLLLLHEAPGTDE